jgi:hypothetical protein
MSFDVPANEIHPDIAKPARRFVEGRTYIVKNYTTLTGWPRDYIIHYIPGYVASNLMILYKRFYRRRELSAWERCDDITDDETDRRVQSGQDPFFSLAVTLAEKRQDIPAEILAAFNIEIFEINDDIARLISDRRALSSITSTYRPYEIGLTPEHALQLVQTDYEKRRATAVKSLELVHKKKLPSEMIQSIMDYHNPTPTPHVPPPPPPRSLFQTVTDWVQSIRGPGGRKSRKYKKHQRNRRKSKTFSKRK